MSRQSVVLKNTGFTIVELLIVIVIIAILAAITVVAYRGVQARAMDSTRLTDMKTIEKALALYKADKGSYPPEAPNPGLNTWEASVNPGFMNSLSDYMKKAPIDPQNSTTSSYRYHTFAAGSNGCSSSLGPYYVLWFNGMDAQSEAYIDSGPCASPTLFPANYLKASDRVIYKF